MDIIKTLAQELKLKPDQVEKTVALIDEGNTIPFIARYRKEVTGSLDDTTLRTLFDRLTYLRNMDKRREEIAALIEAQEKLTPEISLALSNATTLVELEDIYRPFRPKRTTRASIARGKGLAPLAELILEQRGVYDPAIEVAAESYIDEEKGVASAEEALAGAADIIAEDIANDAEHRKALRALIMREGVLTAKQAKEEESVYSDYYDFSEPIPRLKGHRILALHRGEAEEFLKVAVEMDEDKAKAALGARVITNKKSPVTERLVAIVADEELQGAITAGTDAILVLDQTPFYAEMGGQVADHGVIRTETAEFTVTDVQKNKGGKFMHYGKLVSGSLSVGDTVTASIDEKRRKAIMRAHSATHLLDYALRTVLGDHAHQAGSLVEPDRLRYDFTHFSAVTADELVKISRLVSELVLDGMRVETKEMPIDEAKKLGAIALFGEKYGDVVRVVNMGGKSIELCGGTHVDNTAKVGPFRITSESSVASGVRRIEAVTGEAFLNLVDEMNARLVKAAEMLKTTPMELINKAQSSMNEIRELHQTVEKMKDKLFAGDVDSLMFSAKDVSGLKVVTASRENTDANDLRKLGDFLRDKNPNTVAALGSVNGEKVTLLAVCGKNAIARGVKAGDIIRNIAPIVGGKGGGKPDSAMGGGTNALKLDDALAAVDDYVAVNVKD